jgi:AraC family transcriptional regulator
MSDAAAGDRSAAIYEQRMNAAMDFVQDHLGEDLRLDRIADAAGFSPHHFHRLFAAHVGERPTAYVARRRTERAAALLIDQPTRTVSAIAADCGFGTPSAFARSFKDVYGVTPMAWRTGGGAEGTGQALSTEGLTRFTTAMPETAVAFNEAEQSWELRIGALAPGRLHVRHLPQREVAYLRHAGPFQGAATIFGELFAKIITWADSVGIDTGATDTVALYHDDPNLTDDELLRFSACITIPDDVIPDPPVNRTTISGGLYVTASFALTDDEYSNAWNAILGAWLPQSGYEPDDRHYFERFGPDDAVTDGRRPVEICIPIRPLSVGN